MAKITITLQDTPEAELPVTVRAEWEPTVSFRPKDAKHLTTAQQIAVNMLANAIEGAGKNGVKVNKVEQGRRP